MKKFRRAIALLVALVLALAFLPVTASADALGQNLSWSLDNGVLTLTGAGDMPDFSDGHFAPWYEMREQIVKVVLPQGLTTVGDFAFYGCGNLTSAAIPGTVTYIGAYAFGACASLLTVSLPQGLLTIAQSAFRECGALTAISLPQGLLSIGDMAFYRCAGLTSVTVPQSVTEIGAQAFAYCSGLIRARVNANISVVPKWMFYGCDNLVDVSLSASISAADEFSFQNCPNLRSVYSESYDAEIAYKLEKSIKASNPSFALSGFVASYAPPSSTSFGSENVFTTLTEKENTTVAVTDRTDSEGNTKTEISAVVETDDGMRDVIETVKENAGAVDVNVVVNGTAVSGEDLKELAGKDVHLGIRDENGTEWKIDMSKVDAGDIKDEYRFGADVTAANPGDFSVDGDAVYKIKFAGDNNLNSTVGIRLSSSAAYQTATLYQKGMFGSATKLQTVIVDAEGKAWFKLANTDQGTDYFIVVNAAGVTAEDAIVPDTLGSSYGSSGGSTLLDANGNEYVLTGRSSSWGMSLQTVMIILGVVMLVMVAVVAIVMTLLNRRKIAKEKTRR